MKKAVLLQCRKINHLRRIIEKAESMIDLSQFDPLKINTTIIYLLMNLPHAWKRWLIKTTGLKNLNGNWIWIHGHQQEFITPKFVQNVFKILINRINQQEKALDNHQEVTINKPMLP